MRRVTALAWLLLIPAAAGAGQPPVAAETIKADIAAAIDEGRLADAGESLTEALRLYPGRAEFHVLEGDLDLQRGQLPEALEAYQRAESDAANRGLALQGEGIALAGLGRDAESFRRLSEAAASGVADWRTWNALGAYYDGLRQWIEADAAYAKAIDLSGGSAIVLNNRGYSRLLRRQSEAAAEDFAAALRLRPGMSPARTNLRLALAMSGQYDQATEGAGPDDQARLYNNAGLMAAARNDFPQARALLQRALTTSPEYYQRAADNLRIVEMLCHDTGDQAQC